MMPIEKSESDHFEVAIVGEFKSGKSVKFTRVDGGITLQFAAAPTDIDYVIELNY